MKRTLRPELMDDPNLDAMSHRQALSGLARINWFSGSAHVLWPPIRAEAKRLKRPLRVLDVATGAGDVPIRLWQLGKRQGIQLMIEACDISERALQFARERAQRDQAPIRFHCIDALTQDLPTGFDCVTCSLFLHHLTECHAKVLFGKMANSGTTVFVNDLVRSRWSLFLVHIAARLLSRSPVVHTDGPLSIHAAYTMPEAKALAESVGLIGAQVAHRPPCRFLLTWRRE